MNLLTIIFLSIALAMDCLAVSISQSTCLRRPMWGMWVVMAMSFGMFQGMMPLIGFFLMQYFADTITAYDHWIAFIMLGVLGARMIKEDLITNKKPNCEVDEEHHHYGLGKIFLLALATSIDALATGIVFVPFPDWLSVAVMCIGIVSFLFSLIGTHVGYYLGKRFSFKWGVLGGVILIGIGTKILVEHTCFS